MGATITGAISSVTALVSRRARMRPRPRDAYGQSAAAAAARDNTLGVASCSAVPKTQNPKPVRTAYQIRRPRYTRSSSLTIHRQTNVAYRRDGFVLSRLRHQEFSVLPGWRKTRFHRFWRRVARSTRRIFLALPMISSDNLNC
jgi:hypothetical protein